MRWGARAALLGTEGGIELSPGENQRHQQGLPGASVAWDTDRDRDTVIRAHCARQECEQSLPLALQQHSLEMPPWQGLGASPCQGDTWQGGEGDRVTQLW